MNVTLVRHSAFVVTGNPQFEHAVELSNILTKAQETKVTKVGGVIIPWGKESYDREEAENYPPSVSGLIPRVLGTFAKSKIDGSPIYIPNPTQP